MLLSMYNQYSNKNIPVQLISSYNLGLVHIFDLLLTLSALYFSFKCNNGFKLGSFLLACCCSIFYLAYRLAIKCKNLKFDVR